MDQGRTPFPDALIEAARHKRLVPFVGSSIYKRVRNKDGTPLLQGWPKLLQEAARLLGDKRPDDATKLQSLLTRPKPDIYAAAYLARVSMGVREWNRFLHEHINPQYATVDPASLQVSQAIWNLGSPLVITTNQDRTLSWGCPNIADLGNWIINRPDFVDKVYNGILSQPVIWYLHGYIDYPEQMLLSPDNHRRIFPEASNIQQSYRSALHALQQLLIKRTFIFVCYEEDDPSFLHLLRHINSLFHMCGGPHYAILKKDVANRFKGHAAGLPVRLVTYEGHLEDTLNNLAEYGKTEEGDVWERLEEANSEANTMPLKESSESRKPVFPGVALPTRYRLIEKLGQGGMGMVYRAHDRQLERDLAVKVIRPSLVSEDMDKRFSQEAKAIAKLDHSSIVPVYDYGRYRDTVYFTMPLATGKVLRQVMTQEKPTLQQKLEICAQIADALDYSHCHGVVHCDIKPENIMVRSEMEDYKVRIMDFGLAHLTTKARITQPADMMGTPLYLSPEQCTNATIDGRTDIYALGTILYEFLAGETPFSGAFHSLLYKIVNERPPLLLSKGIDIDEELESLVLRCLAKRPENRPIRGRDLATEIRNYMARRLLRSNSSYAWSAFRPAESSVLVGRDKQFWELQLRLDACQAGACQFALLSGDAGMGKSRMLQELENFAGGLEEPFQVWWGRFPDEESAMPYQAFCELLQSYFGDLGDNYPPDLSDLAGELVRLMPVLAEIKSIRDAAGEIPAEKDIADQRGQEYVFDLMARTLLRLAGDTPTLMLLENLTSASSASLEALQYLVHRLGPTQTFIAGTYRSDVPKSKALNRLLHDFRGDRRFLKVHLQPLTQTQHSQLVVNLLNNEEVGEELLERLFATTEGNPYFTHELVRSLKESGGITHDQTERWVLSDEAVLHEDFLPRTIQGAVEERIRHLPDHAREILTIASVLGHQFSFRDLEGLVPQSLNLDDSIDLFLHEGILREDNRSRNDTYRFCGKVMREVLYGALTRRRRRQLHSSHALNLERRYSGKRERVYQALVHHFSQAEDADRCVQYAILLAENSLLAFAPDDAIHNAELALSHVRDQMDEGGALIEGRLCLILANAREAIGQLEIAYTQASNAVRAFKRGNDAGGSADAALKAANTAWRLHKVSATKRWVENGIALARTVDRDATLYELLTLAAKVANLSGDYTRARTYLKEAELIAPRPTIESFSGPIPFGGVLKTAVSRPITSLQPGKIQLTEELEAAACIFETLVQVDASGELVASLAESWSHNEESTVFEFKLRDQTFFSNEVLLRSSHVKSAFEVSARGIVGQNTPAFNEIQGFDAYVSGEANNISGLQTPHNDALRIVLKRSLPLYPALLTDTANTAVFYQDTKETRRKLVGTGPFYIEKREPGSLTLKRNTHYWRQILSMVERVNFKHLENEEAMATALRSGRIDLGRDLSPVTLEELLKHPSFQGGLVESTRKTTAFIIFNRKSPRLSDSRVRRAMFNILRVRELVWHHLGRYAQAATGLIPPGILGHDPARRPGSKTGMESQLLAEAGQESPLKLKAAVHPILHQRYGDLLRGILREWLTLGIEVEIITPNLHSFNACCEGEFETDLLFTRIRGAYDDPDAYTYPILHSKTGTFHCFLGDSGLDGLMDQARTNDNPIVRRQLYRKLEQGLLDSHQILPLFHDIDCRLGSAILREVRLSSLPPFLNYTEIGKVPDRKPKTPQGEVNIPIPGKIEHLDPALMPSYDYGEIVPNIFETLTHVGKGAHIEPWLAEFETVDGGRRYDFIIRDNIFFHNGRRLQARDVRYSFERLLRLSNIHSTLLTCIMGAQAYQEKKVRELPGFTIQAQDRFSIELTRPLSFFPCMLTHPALAILPEGLEPNPDKAKNYIGTGPYRVERFKSDKKIHLTANLHYWQKGFPRNGTLIFHPQMTPQEVAHGFANAKLCIATGLDPADANKLRQKGGINQGIPEAPGLSTYFIVLNAHQGVFRHHERRLAFRQALNIEENVEQALQGMGLPAKGIVPPGLSGNEGLKHKGHPHDSPTALLSNKTLRAAIHPAFTSQYVRFWEHMFKGLEPMNLGIEMIHNGMIANLDGLQNADFIAYRWVADYPDADTFVKLFHSEGLFGSFIKNAHIDLLIEKGRIETDGDLRRDIYLEIEEILAHETVVIPLFHEANSVICQPHLKGLRTRIGFPLVDYSRISIKEEGVRD